jgi:hypothetical protein
MSGNRNRHSAAFKITARRSTMIVGRGHRVRLIGLLIATFIHISVRADDKESLPTFDLTRPTQAGAWVPQNHIASMKPSPEGLEIVISGEDPYLEGPARDFPDGIAVVLHLRLWTDQGGPAQLFHARSGQILSEHRSVRFETHTGWQTVTLPLPPLGHATRFRIDPPGGAGSTCKILALTFERQVAFTNPIWPKPTSIETAATDPAVISGDLTLRHSPGNWGAFALSVDRSIVASGGNALTIGYTEDDRAVWLNVAEAKVTVDMIQDGIRVRAALSDKGGGRWSLRQEFTPSRPGAIDVRTIISVDAPRNIVYAPFLMLFPGLGTYGERKGQAIFAGVEYLDDEPSSSTADLEDPAALRRVPDPVKITFPLMAVQHSGRYVGLIWHPGPHIAALFDSPDRLFGSKSHVLGLIAPSADPSFRTDGKPLPYRSIPLAAGENLECQATLIGGKGDSAVAAVKQYVTLKGLPDRPRIPALSDYVRLASRGWLDTPIRSDSRFFHSIGGFGPRSAADAAWMLEQLAALDPVDPKAKTLRFIAEEMINAVHPEDYNHAMIGHCRNPVAPLVFGRVPETLDDARDTARGMLARIDATGAVRYPDHPEGIDYGRTSPKREASGYAGKILWESLQMAAYSGIRSLVDEALNSLHALDRFRNGVPRGAQTWEIALHTPDILGAAHLVRAYTLGYELTGDKTLLEAARYWAWTGVPFVYLHNPTGKSVGPYATIAVLGATNWKAPVWIGRPVQWCGLVYADALFDLARLDPSGPWSKLAEGITASGLQQTYPIDHPHSGLLPDSYQLRSQSRVPPEINPGTLQPLALRMLTGSPSYSFRVLPTGGLWVHAPGSVEVSADRDRHSAFTVAGWSLKHYFVVVHGLRMSPRLKVNGLETAVKEPHQFLADRGTLILQLEGKSAVEIENVSK